VVDGQDRGLDAGGVGSDFAIPSQGYLDAEGV
jgi:hypothetical protein